MLQNKVDFNKQGFLKSGAIFAYKDEAWLMWGTPDTLLNRPENPVISVCDFFIQQRPSWLSYPYFIHGKRTDIAELFSVLKTSHAMNWKAPEQNNFVEQFDWIQNKIKEQALEKAVPYVFEKASLLDHNFKESFIFHSLKPNNGYLYGYWNEEEGMLGLTPEILIEQNSANSFSTMALAGTTSIKSYEDQPESLTQDNKEIHEHEIVVKDIKEILAQFGEVKVSPREVLKTPSLVHLKTQIEMESSDSEIELLAEKLHPTPALGAYPRDYNSEVMGYLDEKNKRDRFGAPFGFSKNKKQALFVVAIRNVQWTANELKIGSGCGVVKESVCDKEWIELENKRNSVKQIFGVQ